MAPGPHRAVAAQGIHGRPPCGDGGDVRQAGYLYRQGAAGGAAVAQFAGVAIAPSPHGAVAAQCVAGRKLPARAVMLVSPVTGTGTRLLVVLPLPRVP